MRLLPHILLILTYHCAYALSSQALTVSKIIDGDSLIVTGTCAGVELPISVRLQFIDAPEMFIDEKKNPHGIAAKQALERFIKPGTRISLWTAGKRFSHDKHGRVLAVVRTRSKTTAQDHMIKNGYSVYWQRFGTLDKTHRKQHQAWLALEAQAQEQTQALWKSDPQWMKQKQKEGRSP